MTIYKELQHNKAIANVCALSMHGKRFMSFTLNTRLSKTTVSGTLTFMGKDEAEHAIRKTFYKFRRALLKSSDFKNYAALTRYATYERGAYDDHPHIHGGIEIPYGLSISDSRSLFMKYWIKTGWATHINHFEEGYDAENWFDYITKYKGEVLIF